MGNSKDYRPRIADRILERKLRTFGAVFIIGPKGCGKSTTAKQKAKTVIEFEDDVKRNDYLFYAKNDTEKLFQGELPILFDEWKDAPEIYGAVRHRVDKAKQKGLYILTGSTTINYEDLPHTGTGRISRLKMYPMSLYESGESSGSVSLSELIKNPGMPVSGYSEQTMEELAHLIVRGGWPEALELPKEDSALIAKDLYEQIRDIDISAIDGKKRRTKIAADVLSSFAKNICTTAELNTLSEYADVSRPTFNDYANALERLYVIEDIEAWSSPIRSKANSAKLPKHNFIDPSIAAAALGIGEKRIVEDPRFFGFLFESLVLRDLRIYASASSGNLSYYRDRFGLEADAVLHLDDGDYALIEVKLGTDRVDEAAGHLLQIEKRIDRYNVGKEGIDKVRKPTLKMVITGWGPCTLRDDGVYVIPINMLRD